MPANRILPALTFVLAAAAAAAALLRLSGLPIALLAGAVGTGFAVLFAAARETSRQLSSLDARGRGTAPVLKHVSHEVSSKLPRLVERVEAVMTAVEQTPSSTVELYRVYDRLVRGDAPMPDLGGWAATPSSIVWLVDFVARTDATTIVECGSGASTVWLAAALEKRGGDGHVTTLEGSAEYAAQTRAQLERHGLAHRATVIDAPYAPSTDQPWYDIAGLADLAGIDLLFVDGPDGSIAPQARFPAIPMLADRLADGCYVLLDDAERDDETRIVEAWTSDSYAGRTLTVAGQVGRAKLLKVAVVGA